jgi:hypothetical protein
VSPWAMERLSERQPPPSPSLSFSLIMWPHFLVSFSNVAI